MLLAGARRGPSPPGLNLMSRTARCRMDCKLILGRRQAGRAGHVAGRADEFIGPSITDAIAAFEHFPGIMTTVSDAAGTGRRKDHPR